MRKFPRLRISPSSVIFLLTLFLFDGSGLSLIPPLAALCHELGHIAVIYALGQSVGEIELTLFGAEIRSALTSSAAKNIAVFAAGGAANLLSALVVHLLSSSQGAALFVGCSVGLAILNFLPIRSLDGGAILYEVLCGLFQDRGERVFSVISAACLGILWLSAVFLVLRCSANLSLLLFCIYMFATLYFP